MTWDAQLIYARWMLFTPWEAEGCNIGAKLMDLRGGVVKME